MKTTLDARPRVRHGLEYVRREYHGKVQYILRLPDTHKYFQFGESEARLIQLMDGSRSAEEIAAEAEISLGLKVSGGQVADFAHRLKRQGIIQRTPAEQHLMAMEHLRVERKVRTRRRTKGSLLRLRLSLGDPDRLFGRTVGRIGWIWSPQFVVLSLLLFVVLTAIVTARFDEMWGGTLELYRLESGAAVAMFVGAFLLLGGTHELAHGLTTKRFGGRVHEIGVMLLYFSPALFCNTNDAWTFERRSQRLWVTFAGPWSDLLIASVAGITWVFTEPGTLIHQVAFVTALAGGFLSLLTNLNPLVPLDGYYALSDWLEIPNLRRRAFDYWGWLGRRYGLGLETRPPRLTPRERRVFQLYGGLALAYSVAFAAVGAFWLFSLLGKLIGPWAWTVALAVIGSFLVRWQGRARSVASALVTLWRGGRMRRRLSLALASLVLAAALPFVIPWTFRAKGPVTIVAVPRIQIHAETGGILERLYVREGDSVRAGTPLIELWNPQLEAATAEQRAAIERLRLRRSRATARGDLASAAGSEARLAEALEALRVLEAQRSRLIVSAPIDGVILGYRLHERTGQRIRAGDLLFEIASLRGRQARVRVPTRLAGGLSPGQIARLRLSAAPHLEFSAPVSSVAPAAEEGWVELQATLPAGPWQPLPGMTGRAKVARWRGTLAEAIGRKLRQTLRTDLWL